MWLKNNFISLCALLLTFICSLSTLETCDKDSCVDDGGWTTEFPAAEPGPCNIDVRDSSLSQKEFIKKYAYQAPVVITGSNDNSVFKELSTKQNMLSRYGNKMIRVSTANTYSYEKVDVKLEKYISDILKPQSEDTIQKGNETLYWFGDNNHKEWADLFDTYVPPPYTLPGVSGVYSFGVAGAGTGVPFHFHGPGFAETVYGRKRWFLYPPYQEPKFHPNHTTLHWLNEEYPKLTGPNVPYECTIEPGQAIYFPDRWWHGTLNLDTSVFISTFLA